MNVSTMDDPGTLTSLGEGRAGVGHVFQNGVWLTKGRVERIDKYHKWAEEQAKSEVQRLDKEEHERLVKLNGQCLDVRTELRGLKNERHLINHRRHHSSDALEDRDVIFPATHSFSAPTTPRGLHKSSSSGSLTSFSSGYSSLGSTTSSGKRSRGVEAVNSGGERPAAGSTAARGAKLPGSATTLKNLQRPGVSASRVKSLTSARALSKLNNNMEIC